MSCQACQTFVTRKCMFIADCKSSQLRHRTSVQPLRDGEGGSDRCAAAITTPPTPLLLSLSTTNFKCYFLYLIKHTLARKNANRNIRLSNYTITYINDSNNNNRNSNVIHCTVYRPFY